MIQIKWFARGGQGGFTACRLMALAAVRYSGCYAQAFPSFGPERRGAPVYGFTRIDDRPVRDHSQVYAYDYGVVVDQTLLTGQDVTAGLKEGGTLFVNSQRTPEELGLSGVHTVTFDADAVALRVLKAKIANTAMMALAAQQSGLADLDALEQSCRELLPARILEGNLQVVREVFAMAEEKKHG